MGLNPVSDRALELQQKILDDNLNGGSPYYGMYHCGYYGVPFEKCVEKCSRNGIVLREKDIRSYNDGAFKRGVGVVVKSVGTSGLEHSVPIENMKLEEFPKMPIGWEGSSRRFFPCTQDNKPMQKWGWSRDFTPELHTYADAKVLSPCGWVGQNMLYQKFIVVDIDGRGHGTEDLSTIEFGEMFKDETFAMEDPAKPGSFHLYFETDRLIPVRHFPWAKIDLMGNAVNAAVYFKNKKWNGRQMHELTEEIWQMLIAYQRTRKELG